MKATSAVLAIIVLILWLASLAYIIQPALSTNSTNSTVLIPTPPMGNVPPGFLGVLLFLLGIVVITFWAGMGPDKEEEESGENKTTGN